MLIQPLLKVILIDDEPRDAALIKRCLDVSLPGMIEVTPAYPVTHAIALLEEWSRSPTLQSCNLILLDYFLGAENGIDVLKKIKGNPDLAMIPVVMVSGSWDKQIILDAITAGAAGWLRKDMTLRSKLTQLAEYWALCTPIPSK